MTVREVLVIASQFLNIEDDVKEYIAQDDGVENGSKTFKTLFNALNIVYKEIASDYFALMTEEEIMVQNNKIFYFDLKNEPKDIYSISSIDNVSKYKFKTFDEYVKLSCNGLVKIVYSYMPKDVKITDLLQTFGGKITTRTFALAVASEYCFISNIFDDAKVWHERFCESIKNIHSTKSNNQARKQCSQPWSRTSRITHKTN